MPGPSICPVCHDPDVPFGGESVCDCPDEDEHQFEGARCLDCGSPWGVVWGSCDFCDGYDDIDGW